MTGFMLLVRIAAVLLGAYAMAVVAVAMMQRQLLYHPPSAALPAPQEAGLPAMRPVTLKTADGLDLTAWYAPPAGEDGLVILHLHGNAGSLANRAHKYRPFLEAGHGLLAVEYRGYAGNPGRPHEQGLVSDARAGLLWLQAESVPLERIVLYGESLGSGVAVLAADARPLAAVVLETPYDSMVAVGREHYPWLPVGWFLRDRYAAAARIPRVRAPILMLVGGRDRTIPPPRAEALLAAAPEPARMARFPGAAHNDLFDHGAAATVLEFLDSLPLSGTVAKGE